MLLLDHPLLQIVISENEWRLMLFFFDVSTMNGKIQVLKLLLHAGVVLWSQQRYQVLL